jgi:hypothetical protein
MKELIVSNSFYDFLMDNDSKPIVRFIKNAINYAYRDYPIWRMMIDTSKINYLTLRDDGSLSFLPAGKEHIVTENGTWSRKSRQAGAPAKVIKKLLTPRAAKLFKDVDFEQFANSYKSACDAETKRFEIWENTKIPNVYCMKREHGGGTLNDSCMNGDSDYLDMYFYCPKLRIIVLLNKDNELCGRALLWQVGEDEYLMDRIYVAKDHYYDMFLEYAEENGFVRKVEYKTFRERNTFVKNGNVFEKYYKIVTPTTHSYYPYIDTFCYGDDGYLTNKQYGPYCYNYTDGTREGDERMVYDELNGRDIPEDESRYIDRGRYRDCYIHEEDSVYVDGYYYWNGDDQIVEVNDTWYRTDSEDIVCIDGTFYEKSDDDVIQAEDDCEWYLKEDCHWCEYDDCYYSPDTSMVYSEHHSSYLRAEYAVETPDGKIWHKEDITACE